MAAALGNRRVAEQLHLSRKTVESHVSSIYFDTQPLLKADIIEAPP